MEGRVEVPDGAAQERDKYAEIWGFEQYREYSPGLENVPRFMDVVKPKKGETLLDIGCGEGGAGLEFQKLGLKVNWLDITDAGLSPEVPRDKFIESPLWADWGAGWQYGFCCDVMEHIPPEFTMLAADRIVRGCGTVWFHICLVPDEFGKMIGEPLHLTVRPYDWWLIRLGALGRIVDARDLCGNGLYIVERK